MLKNVTPGPKPRENTFACKSYLPSMKMHPFDVRVRDKVRRMQSHVAREFRRNFPADPNPNHRKCDFRYSEAKSASYKSGGSIQPLEPFFPSPRARQHNITVVSKRVSGLTLFMSRPIIIHRTVTSLAWSFTRGPLLFGCSCASSIRDFAALGNKPDTGDQ